MLKQFIFASVFNHVVCLNSNKQCDFFFMMLSVSMFFELENLEDQLLASFVGALFDCA